MRWFFILLFALGTLFIACDSPTDTKPTPIADVLKALETAYNNADLAAYKATLDASNYLFHFSEQDQQDPDWDIPETYNYTQDTDSTEKMFTVDWVGSIELTLALPEFTEPANGTNNFVLDEVVYEILITIPDDNVTYRSQANCKFELAKIDGNWLISALWDYFGDTGGLCDEDTSWGYIKYIFGEDDDRRDIIKYMFEG
jgi:hypothetical protein